MEKTTQNRELSLYPPHHLAQEIFQHATDFFRAHQCDLPSKLAYSNQTKRYFDGMRLAMSGQKQFQAIAGKGPGDVLFRRESDIIGHWIFLEPAVRPYFQLPLDEHEIPQLHMFGYDRNLWSIQFVYWQERECEVLQRGQPLFEEIIEGKIGEKALYTYPERAFLLNFILSTKPFGLQTLHTMLPDDVFLCVRQGETYTTPNGQEAISLIFETRAMAELLKQQGGDLKREIAVLEKRTNPTFSIVDVGSLTIAGHDFHLYTGAEPSISK